MGKTSLSLYLAEKQGASIINCDSIQMYKGLNIGSAKPRLSLPHSRGDLRSHFILQEDKKIPSFLFNEYDPPFNCTVGAFRKKALAILSQEISQNFVWMVGGSGFYIQALEKGMYPIKAIKPEIKKKVKKIYEEQGRTKLYEMLKFLDPKYATKIKPQDTYRIFRGICIILSEEKPLTLIQDFFKEEKLPWPTLKIGLYLPRDILLKKVQERTYHMIKQGLAEEVQALLNKNLKNWPGLKSVGYKETCLYLQNKLSKEEWNTAIVNRTMKLAKKQITWFKRDKSIKWYDSSSKKWPQIYQNLFLV